MARKSRYAVTEAPVAPTSDFVYDAAGYIRRSEEDNGEAASLENQALMVRNYIERTPGLKLYGTFSDNGQTGTNFQRPGFEDLMDGIRRGKINCVVVKDLSRFGRDYIEAGNFLEVIFPRLGVRFISIGDNFDSFDPRCKDEGMAVALKNMINAFYAKDISVKTRTAKEAKRRKGEYCGTFPPFGYLKSPEDRHKLIIDEDAAAIVRDIFRWKLEGLTLADIRKRLDETGVPTPGYYRYIKGIHKDRRCAKPIYWHGTTVRDILENPIYLGHLTLGKSTVDPNRPYVNIHRPEEEWVVTKNCHEPIISQADFDAVAAMLRVTKERYYESVAQNPRVEAPPNIFAGLAFCADCGRVFQRIQHVAKDGKSIRFTYICPTCKRSAPDRANRRYFKEKDFTAAVHATIMKQIEVHANSRRLDEKAQTAQPAALEREQMEKDIRRLQIQFDAFPAKTMKLYDDYCNGILSENEYRLIRERYEAEHAARAARLVELTASISRLQPEFVGNNLSVTEFVRFSEDTELTREMLAALVERIEVKANLSIEIIFRYRDEYAELVGFVEESGVSCNDE